MYDTITRMFTWKEGDHRPSLPVHQDVYKCESYNILINNNNNNNTYL